MAKKGSGKPQEGPAPEPESPGAAERQAPPQQPQTGARPRPAHEVRMGRIRATLWANHHPEQGVWHSVVLSRSYRDKEGNWKTASSFGKDDCLVVAEAMRLAFHWIVRASQQPAQAPSNGTASEEGAAQQGSDDVPF